MQCGIASGFDNLQCGSLCEPADDIRAVHSRQGSRRSRLAKHHSRGSTLHRLLERLRAKLGSEERTFLATGSVGALALRVGGTGATLLLQIFLARILGVQSFGDYIYVLSWIGLVAMCATLGLDTSALRYVAEYVSQDKPGLTQFFLRRSLFLVSAASVVLALLVIGTVELLGQRLSISLRHTFLASTLLLPALALLLSPPACCAGTSVSRCRCSPEWLLRPLFLIGAASLLLVTMVGVPSAASVMLADGAVTALLLLYLLATIRRLRPSGIAAPADPPVRQWIATSLPMLALTLVRLSMNRIDILLVGGLVGTAEAGIYAVAVQMSILISFGPMAVNHVAAPLFAELDSQRRKEELQHVVTLGTRGGFLFSLAVAAGIFLLASPILSLYGPEFLAARLPLFVLVGSQVLGATAGSVGFLMIMTGNERPAAWLTGAAGLLNLALNALLIPSFGLLGAAVASGAANIAWTGGLALAVKRWIAIDPTVFRA